MGTLAMYNLPLAVLSVSSGVLVVAIRQTPQTSNFKFN